MTNGECQTSSPDEITPYANDPIASIIPQQENVLAPLLGVETEQFVMQHFAATQSLSENPPLLAYGEGVASERCPVHPGARRG